MSLPGRLAGQVSTKLFTLKTLAEAGILGHGRPDQLLGLASAVLRWGATPAAGYAAAVARFRDAPALVDELGTLTFGQVHQRTNALAHALSDDGLGEGDRVALMARNHRGFVEALVACSKLGCHVLLLNTQFSGPQLADVARREKPRAIVFDQEFAEVLRDAGRRRKRYVAWHDDAGAARPADPTLESLIGRGDPADVVPPAAPGRATILTSGTTGTPKGAARSQPRNLDPVAALLAVIPLRAREPTMLAAPMFHSWGWAHFLLASALGSTVVLRHRFDPEATLSLCAQHECTALVVVPVMLQRILELPDATLRRYDLSALRTVAVSGAALPPALSERWMDVFGENLYNLYGSTEVAWASIATPRDLRAAPGTAGRPPRGTVLRLYDEQGKPVTRPGVTGRIFVANDVQFEGYTGGGGKAVIDGLLSSGDVGHLDAAGRLFIDGRDDDMIVSGGENVFPAEVEDLLAGHPAVAEVAVFGVDDEAYGQRLKAVVVRRPGAALTEAEAKAYVKANLAGYKVPRDVAFVEELPRTATGKVVKRALQGAG